MNDSNSSSVKKKFKVCPKCKKETTLMICEKCGYPIFKQNETKKVSNQADVN